jgi:hypothetical protein
VAPTGAGATAGVPVTKPAVRHTLCTMKCQPIVSSTNAGDRTPKPCADCAIRTVVARMSGTIASSLLNQLSTQTAPTPPPRRDASVRACGANRQHERCVTSQAFGARVQRTPRRMQVRTGQQKQPKDSKPQRRRDSVLDAVALITIATSFPVTT